MLTDDQLAVQARTDPEAFERLAESFAGMMRFIAAGRFAPGLARSDFDQIALIGLWRAVRTFDPERGKFGPLAQLAIQRTVDTAVKTALRGKHQILNDAWRAMPDEDGHIMDAVDIVPNDRDDPVEILIAREELATVISVVKHQLTPLEQAAVAGRIDGDSYEQINERLLAAGDGDRPGRASYSKWKSVDNALVRARRKIDEALKRAA